VGGRRGTLSQRKEEWQSQQRLAGAGGNQCRKKEAPITVPGFLDALAEGIAITMLQIPEGKFQMGSPPQEDGRLDRENDQHWVEGSQRSRHLPARHLGRHAKRQG